MLRKITIPALFLILAPALFAQSTEQWQRTEQKDAFSGTSYTQFLLTGHFLTAPRIPPSVPPSLILRCNERRKAYGYHEYSNGKLLSAYLNVGAVLDRTLRGVPVMYRLDDGKPQSENWDVSTDGTSVFFGEMSVDTMLYGHFLPHKENTSPPVHKVVIAVDEYMGAQVVIQFDLPDPTLVADACGVLLHKK